MPDALLLDSVLEPALMAFIQIKIEHVETLLRGHAQGTPTITLPWDLAGECSPEG